MSTTYPFGYQRQFWTLDGIRAWLLEHHHPEYVRRFCAWLESTGGEVGPGGGWRAVQPVRPGFADPGKSFHQDQTYNDGFVGACAVDVVRRNPDSAGIHLTVRWSDVPAQGSDEARRWGLHANVGTPGVVGSEPWHIQPIEIDGWQSWMDGGCPCPHPNYPLPNEEDEPVTEAEIEAIAERVAAKLTNVIQAYAPESAYRKQLNRIDRNTAEPIAAPAVAIARALIAELSR